MADAATVSTTALAATTRLEPADLAGVGAGATMAEAFVEPLVEELLVLAGAGVAVTLVGFGVVTAAVALLASVAVPAKAQNVSIGLMKSVSSEIPATVQSPTLSALSVVSANR